MRWRHPVRDAGLLHGEGPATLKGARGVERFIWLTIRRFHASPVPRI